MDMDMDMDMDMVTTKKTSIKMHYSETVNIESDKK